MAGPAGLTGFTVVVTADRCAREQTAMLMDLGATVVSAPTIATAPIETPGSLRAGTEDLIAGPPDYLIASTGLGIRSWMAAAAGWGVRPQLQRALSRTRVAARGPKAAAAITAAGLEVWWEAETEQLASVAARLLVEPLAGSKVAVQLPGDSHPDLSRLLRRAGASVVELPVYRWTLPEDTDPAERAMDLMCSGGVDAVTFTAGPAVRNLMALADRSRRGRQVLAALNGDIIVACMGPACAETARAQGIEAPVWPERWRLGSLVALVAQDLTGRQRHLSAGGHQLVLQGTAVIVNGHPVGLTGPERALLAKLSEAPGTTVSRRILLRHVWKDPGTEPHLLETTIVGLRAKLGPSADALETVSRRGYRLRLAPPGGPA